MATTALTPYSREGPRMHFVSNVDASHLAETLRGIAFPRQALHAHRLGFKHPDTREQLRFEVPVPEDMRNLLGQLGSR
jgi:hypothetical protein